jgi:hypothetical protein
MLELLMFAYVQMFSSALCSQSVLNVLQLASRLGGDGDIEVTIDIGSLVGNLMAFYQLSGYM